MNRSNAANPHRDHTLSMIIGESKIAVTGKNLIMFSLKQIDYIFKKVYKDMSKSVKYKDSYSKCH